MSIPEFIKQNVQLAPLTSWQIGGPAEYLARPRAISELKEALLWAQKNQKAVKILSGGSNLLIADQGVSGLVIYLKNLTGITSLRVEKEILFLDVLAGTPKSELLKILLKYKSSAALFLAGIPGDVGGGVVMNAGVAEKISPREFCEIVDWVKVLKDSGVEHRLAASDLCWSYRHCTGWEPGVLVEVGFKFKIQDDPDILIKVREANKLRLQKQPLDQPSCGSVFKNPEGLKAAQLIEQCGLKGLKMGQAQVSLKHANFIVNLGGATAKDTWALIQKVQEEVLRHCQVDLQTEVREL